MKSNRDKSQYSSDSQFQQHINKVKSKRSQKSQFSQYIQRSKIQLNDNSLPKTYFDLIEKVDSKGKYQFRVFTVFFIVFYVCGMLALGTSFLFMNYQFDCKNHGLLTQQCSKNICSLKQQQWQNYLIKPPTVQSVATQYGPFYCDNQTYLSLIQAAVYLGIFFGLLIFLYITDNYGRKFSIVLAWGVTTLGCVIVSISVNIIMITIGSFLAGAGSQATMRICFSIINQISEYFYRQKASVIVSMAYGLAGVFIGVIYFIIPQWRIVFIAFIAIPAVICQGFLIFYLQQTPKYLLRKGIKPTLKAMDKISKVNKKQKGIVTQQDIKNVMEQEIQEDQFNKNITPIDIFRFPSLRSKSICFSIIFFIINYLYLGPILGIASLGIDIFVSQIMLSLAQLITYPFTFKLIQKLPRKQSGYYLLGLSTIFTGILIFIQKPQVCNFCFEGVFELTLASLSRLCCALYYSILFLYVPQSFPQRARGQSFGVASSLNAIAAVTGTIILGFLSRNGISSYIFFTLCSVIGIACLVFLDQTKGKPLQVQIEEIQMKKDQLKTVRLHQRTNYVQSTQIKTANFKRQ